MAVVLSLLLFFDPFQPQCSYKKKIYFNSLVSLNVGLLYNVVPGTFLCILSINYAMLTP